MKSVKLLLAVVLSVAARPAYAYLDAHDG